MAKQRAEAQNNKTQPVKSRPAQSRAANLDRLITAKSAEDKRLRATMSDYQRRIEVGPTRESDLSELSRDYETLQQIYRGLLGKKEDSKVAANLERRQIGEQFKILA